MACFRQRGSDEQARRLLDMVNALGKASLSSIELNEQFVIRFAVGNLGTTHQDVDEIWNLSQKPAP